VKVAQREKLYNGRVVEFGDIKHIPGMVVPWDDKKYNVWHLAISG
jgi:hypothetical protein